MTTSPTIFARAITDSGACGAQLRDLKLRRAPVDRVLRELAAFDVRQACDVLRPNLFIKIPAARPGLPAISACLAGGVGINLTLIFSLARYGEVIDSFLAGLEQARDAGRDLSGLASVASFFVSRADAGVGRRLDRIGAVRAAALRGKAAIASARLAYQRCGQGASTARWKSLERAGARPPRPLRASAGVKDPDPSQAAVLAGLLREAM